MVFPRALSFVLVPLLFTSLLSPASLRAQEVDRIWGRVQTVSGEVHEGFIRWDRNEGSWVDQLDGSKEITPFQFQDWWKLAHPGDLQRDRVIELAGYRITWDDGDPDFPSSAESGIRFGHILRLAVDEDVARLEPDVLVFTGDAVNRRRESRVEWTSEAMYSGWPEQGGGHLRHSGLGILAEASPPDGA